MNKDGMIEKVARAICLANGRRVEWWEQYRQEGEAALDALGLLDGSSWIAPWEATLEMRYAWEGEGGFEDWARMRDAALSAPEST